MEYFDEGSCGGIKKEIPKNHNIEDRFACYERAKGYIKHITKVIDNTIQKSAEYDSSCIESLNFRAKLPQINGKYKISTYPNVQLSEEVIKKIAVINAYNQPSPVKEGKGRRRVQETVISQSKSLKRGNDREIFWSFTHKSSKLCIRCNYNDLECQCRSKSPKPKRELRYVDRTYSPTLVESGVKRPEFVIRSMNGRDIHNKRKTRTMKSYDFCEDNSYFMQKRLFS